jgi:general stress protein CsbA
MAKVQNKRKSGRRVIQAVPEAELPQRMNYVIIIAGVVTLLAGFLIMSSGDAVSSLSVTIAPVILFIGYCVIIPVGIMYRKKKTEEKAAE